MVMCRSIAGLCSVAAALRCTFDHAMLTLFFFFLGIIDCIFIRALMAPQIQRTP